MNPDDVKRFDKFCAKLQGKIEKGVNEYMSLCPAHGDCNVSLWVKLNEGGKIHVDCKAGCGVSEVCEALGFKIGVLYGVPQIEAIYEYLSADGELLYQEVKYDRKSQHRFAVRRLNPKYKEKRDKDGNIANKDQQWIYDTKGIDLVLFNLREVLNAEPDKPVFMCEGAKDAKTVLGKGLISTAALLNDWFKTDTSPLDGRKIMILVDNDEAGETKALKAAHDRYGKSVSIKLLRLPGLGEGGDVTDWFEAGGNNTLDRFLELALDPKLPEWSPKESVRERIENGQMTGLPFEHANPLPIVEMWLQVFHPPELGLLTSYDNKFYKGNPKTHLYREIDYEIVARGVLKLLQFSSNAKSKGTEEDFKPISRDVDEVLRIFSMAHSLSILDYPSFPIFRTELMPDTEQNFIPKDVAVMKSHNFFIPKKQPYPRNMETCIAVHALPFDYDPDAKCPEIEKALKIQWGDDQESIDLLLQFIYYCMISNHDYKAILSMVGDPNTGKSQILNLITAFIGAKSCEAISLGKLGLQFELFRALSAKLLICDDENVTKKDLAEGTLTENLLSIPAGRPIRVEKKGGAIETRILPGQIIMAGNRVLKMHENAGGIGERLRFLAFRHVFRRNKDMNPRIIDVWTKELPGLMNLVLQAGAVLVENNGFIEPKTSQYLREQFETASNPVKPFAIDCLEVGRTSHELETWRTTCEDMAIYYSEWCTETGSLQETPQKFNSLLGDIPGIQRKPARVSRIDSATGKAKETVLRCWVGCRRKGTKGDGTATKVKDPTPF